jgi:hypothetical protein
MSRHEAAILERYWTTAILASKAGAAAILGHTDADLADIATTSALRVTRALASRFRSADAGTEEVKRMAKIAGRRAALDELCTRHGRAGAAAPMRRVDPLRRADRVSLDKVLTIADEDTPERIVLAAEEGE